MGFQITGLVGQIGVADGMRLVEAVAAEGGNLLKNPFRFLPVNVMEVSVELSAIAPVNKDRSIPRLSTVSPTSKRGLLLIKSTTVLNELAFRGLSIKFNFCNCKFV